MSTANTGPVSVTVNPTFWELFVASLILIRYQRWARIIHVLFPLFGLYIFVNSLYNGYGFGPAEIVLMTITIGFTPWIVALSLWAARARNKLARGPYTYGFDQEGVYTTTSSFEQLIKWPAILRVRLSKRFLFLFISPSRALCIPVKSLHDQGVFEDVCSLARQHSDFR
jgi:hypothetical protein